MAAGPCFLETVTLRALPSLLARRPSRAWYIDGSGPALWLARLAARAAGFPFEKLSFKMIEVRDENDLMLRLRIAFQDMNEIQKEIVAEKPFQDWLARETGEGRLPSFLAKSVARGAIYLNDGNLWRAMYLIQAASCRLKKDGEASGVFLLDDRAWFSAVRRYAAACGIEAEAVPAPLRLKAAARRLLSAGVQRLLRHAQAHGLRGLSRYFRPGPPPPARPRLGAEYYGNLNLDEPELQSNLFFWQRSKLAAEDILILYGTVTDPLDAARLADIRRHGMDALAIHPAAAADLSVPLFYPRLRAKAPERFPGPRTPETRWLAERTREYREQRAFWTELFERENVKVFVTWYKSDPNHCAVADALQSLGGVTALYEQSYVPHPSSGLTSDVDVHFYFSRASVDVARLNNSRIRYNVVTGFLGDHRFELLRESSRALRERLQKNGARKIVALFDENSLDDLRWHTGHELQRSNYALLLEKVLSEPWLGLVIKPKAPSTLRRRLGPLAGLLERAEATGRCHVFEGGKLHGAHAPVEAALAADIAVHGHLCAGTAAVEAALAGVPTLLIDQEGWGVSPLYRLGKGRVVFTDWSELWTALAEHWDRPGGVPGFGDWTPMLDELDPFRDGRAAERMGDYLKWIMEGFHEGLDREAAMARAAERYGALWGRDKVSELAGRDWRSAPL